MLELFFFPLDSAEQLVAHQSVLRRPQPKGLLEQVGSGKLEEGMKQKLLGLLGYNLTG